VVAVALLLLASAGPAAVADRATPPVGTDPAAALAARAEAATSPARSRSRAAAAQARPGAGAVPHPAAPDASPPPAPDSGAEQEGEAPAEPAAEDAQPGEPAGGEPAEATEEGATEEGATEEGATEEGATDEEATKDEATKKAEATKKEASKQPAEPPKPVGGLNRRQMAHAATIVRVGQELGLPRRAYVVALATALQESNLKVLASTAIPKSHGYPNDGVGSDHDSVGLFQQRPSMGWGTVAECMDPVNSARSFYAGLRQVSGWRKLPITVAAQAVQVSAFPNHYAKHERLARKLVKALT
jgi:hypothetical protein